MYAFMRARTGVLLAALLCVSGLAAQERAFDLGMEAISDYRHSVALMHFMSAAEHGDRDAQRSLGLMLLYGGRLYGSDVQANREQATHWLRKAAANGCEVSAFMLKVMAAGGT
jgi:TPR repeat protein